jgi:hypothetical protein
VSTDGVLLVREELHLLFAAKSAVISGVIVNFGIVAARGGRY